MQKGANEAPRRHVRGGFTIVEMLLVVSVLVALAAVVLPSLEESRSTANATAVRASLVAVRASIVGDDRAPGFLADLGELPATIAQLFVAPAVLPSGRPVALYDPALRGGWNGPYLLDSGGRYRPDANGEHGFTTAYGVDGDPAVLDPWGRALVLQRPVVEGAAARELDRWTRLVSAGEDGVLTTPRDRLDPDPQDPAEVGDDIVLYLFAGRD